MNVKKRRKNREEEEEKKIGIAAVTSISSLMVVTILGVVVVMPVHGGYKPTYRSRKKNTVEREQIFPLCSIYTFLH